MSLVGHMVLPGPGGTAFGMSEPGKTPCVNPLKEDIADPASQAAGTAAVDFECSGFRYQRSSEVA